MLGKGKVGSASINAELATLTAATAAIAADVAALDGAAIAAAIAATAADAVSTAADVVAAEAAKTGAETAQAAAEAATVLPTCTVATAPAAAENSGKLIYVSDGSAGNPCLAFSNGVNWLVIALGVAIAGA